MDHEPTDLRWGVERRLEFIEFRLFWEGAINRSDIIHRFGVSVPQASKDLTQYQELAPGNIAYDKSEKRYFAKPDFRPRFLRPDPDAYFAQLRSLADGLTKPEESWIGRPPEADIALTPKRDVDVDVLREILDATRYRRSLEVLYQSMNKVRPDPLWRRISPHAFGYDGFRWHARAYCHLENKFKDFLLPRVLGVRDQSEAGASGDQDRLWHEYFELVIAPHPGLTPAQKQVVEKDYGMTEGKAVFPVRYAMVFYVVKRLGLLGHPEQEDPRRQHIVALNKDDVQDALNKSNYSQEVIQDREAILAGNS